MHMSISLTCFRPDMIRQCLIAASLAGAGIASVVHAASPGAVDVPKPQQAPGQPGMMGHGMMGGNMADMMRSCQSMMGSSGMMSGMALPKSDPRSEP